MMFQTLLKNTLFILALVVLGNILPQSILAQTIKGQLIDQSNETAISDAIIGIESTNISVISDEFGDFEIPNAPTGNQNLIITASGYEAIQLKVTVPSSGVTMNI